MAINFPMIAGLVPNLIPGAAPTAGAGAAPPQLPQLPGAPAPAPAATGAPALDPLTLASGLQGLGNEGVIGGPQVTEGDPFLNNALITLGAQLMQPVQPGQSVAGHVGQAALGTLQATQQAREAEEERGFRESQLGLAREEIDVRRETAAAQLKQAEVQHQDILQVRERQVSVDEARVKQLGLKNEADKVIALSTLSTDYTNTLHELALTNPEIYTPDRIELEKTLHYNRLAKTLNVPQQLKPWDDTTVQQAASLKHSQDPGQQAVYQEWKQMACDYYEPGVLEAVDAAPPPAPAEVAAARGESPAAAIARQEREARTPQEQEAAIEARKQYRAQETQRKAAEKRMDADVTRASRFSLRFSGSDYLNWSDEKLSNNIEQARQFAQDLLKYPDDRNARSVRAGLLRDIANYELIQQQRQQR